ncbi:MAG TPA: nitrile hydratase subunit beta [Dongiaceae bacterium]|nr:nitrile hydratase subunit beta [Dongiaceae bacterium]
MNSIHDLGGMHGFGAIEAERSEPPFHEPWEGRAAGILEVMTFPAGFTVDRFRYLRETLRPDLYLTQTYYEQWIYIAEQALLESGMISPEESARGEAQAPKRTDAMRADAVWGFLHDRTQSERDLDERPRFAIGQRVLARNLQPTGHTRLPRYARGKTGSIVSHHGAHMLPDASAHGKGDMPQHLYSVRFAARALWGENAHPHDRVHLDLWESYLEPA